jgi:hypothetical protein
MKKISVRVSLPFTMILTLGAHAPSTAWAVQQHGGAEGLVSHQIGHVLFILGMGYLLYQAHRNPIVGPGWREFRGFLRLIVLWNILTFSGHWVREFIDPQRFLKAGSRTIAFTIEEFPDALFYLSSLDHLLLVPAFFLLLLALRKWRSQV